MLALIPARGGSKRLPGKNVRLLGSIPLIAHSIKCARNCPHISRVVVSTDCTEIAGVSRQFGAEVPFLRSPELASDQAESVDVFLDAMDRLECEEMVVLQPTRPLRLPRHLSEALELFHAHQADSVVSCLEDYPASWHFRRQANGTVTRAGLNPAEKLLIPNGSLYVVRRSSLLRYGGYLGEATYPYLMSDTTSVDIDTLEDFQLAEALLASGVLSRL